MPDLVIEIWGGLVQTVYSEDLNLHVLVADRDALEGEDGLLLNHVTVQPLHALPDDLETTLSSLAEACHA